MEQAEGSFKLNAIGFDADEKIAVIFGNEVAGVEQSTISLCDGCIEIPQLGMKHSLNIATAAGVVLWELVRTRMSLSLKGNLDHRFILILQHVESKKLSLSYKIFSYHFRNAFCDDWFFSCYLNLKLFMELDNGI